ncbi:MAG: polyprenol monophosphomannose synthase [Flavobacteriia bacterium]|nr:polyprenol monophosphomannose synthase [Flavobacteriia bacterium]
MADTILIIPTYNERENIVLITEAIFTEAKEVHILFVDDNSPDGTQEEIDKMMLKYPEQVFVLKREGKLGLGTAYIAGFKWALERSYTYVFEMDSDFSHNPKDILRLKKRCVEGADLAIGSRYCPGGKIENWPYSRWLLSYFANLYVRLVLWIRIKDSTAGFKCYQSSALATLSLDQISFKGYAFQICMKYAVIKKKFKVVEVPITFKDRLYGDSKMSSGIFKEALFGVWKMRNMRF